MEDLLEKPSNREFLVQVMTKLAPGTNWVVSGEKYEEILWFEQEVEKPSEEQVQTELQNLISDWENKNYRLQRQFEYPSVKDQLDMLYHVGYDGWKEAINNVKQKYPKPE